MRTDQALISVNFPKPGGAETRISGMSFASAWSNCSNRRNRKIAFDRVRGRFDLVFRKAMKYNLFLEFITLWNSKMIFHRFQARRTPKIRGSFYRLCAYIYYYLCSIYYFGRIEMNFLIVYL